ncbi:MAG: hypothetical protein HRT67_13895 [Flavobacteriaceae bacterium]|nr:hypothetical protein [Flavobacteriaceae bacterium]
MFLKYLKAIKVASLLLLIGMGTASCGELEKEITHWFASENTPDLPGNYHFLSDKGIKVYLPEDFKKYSLASYQELLKKNTPKNNYNYALERLSMLKKMEGSFYIFYDENSGSTFTVNTIAHFKFSREDASQLLGYIKLTNAQKEGEKKLNIKKLTAKYTGNSNQQIFKSIHSIENLKSKTNSYNTAYIISSNNNTVIMQLLTPMEVAFDAYIQKLKM